ncbi:hypothetical protein D3C80_1699190 [compost metagenome]
MNRNADDSFLIGFIHILVFHFRRSGHTVFQLDARLKLVQCCSVRYTLDRGQIRLRHVMLRMGEQVSKLSVIRQQQQPFRVIIQTAHRIYALIDAL